MYHITFIIHSVLAFVIIGAVLLQVGKGSGMASSFGGASNTLFGSQGASNFLFKFTAYLLIAFYCTSLLLSHFENQNYRQAIDSAIPKEDIIPVKKNKN